MAAQPFKITGGLMGTEMVISASSDGSPHLVDSNGLSLYTSLKDTPGVSNCSEECQKNWLPVITTGRLVNGSGVMAASLGVLVLPDGNRQVTYNGLPLYYYAKDQKPGDMLGEGIGGIWFLATP